MTSTAILILQMVGGAPDQIQSFSIREQAQLQAFVMQLYKQARIHTPNRVSDSTFGVYDESIETLLR